MPPNDPFCPWAASPVYRCRNGVRAVAYPRYNRHTMSSCQVCGGTIDAARSQAALLRRKTPTYCSARCYRAGIKRAYRAKRVSRIAPLHDEPRLQPQVPLDQVGADAGAFETRPDEMRVDILKLAKLIAERLNFPAT
jgi:hypothetical protein